MDEIHPRAIAGPTCLACGRAVAPGARFCGACGTKLTGSGVLKSGVDPVGAKIVLFGTIGWALISMLFASGFGITAAWVQESVIIFAIFLPWLLVLLVAVQLIGTLFNSKTHRWRIGSPGPWLLLLVTVTWFLIMNLVSSYVMIDPFTAILLVLFPSIGLAGACVVLTVGSVQGLWKTPSAPGIVRMAVVLIPLPIAATALFVLLEDDAPLRARFEASESAMVEKVQHFESSGSESSYDSSLVGLYDVEAVYRHSGCVILQTMRGIDETGGFAYCPGRPPADPELEHLKDQWWIYRSWH